MNRKVKGLICAFAMVLLVILWLCIVCELRKFERFFTFIGLLALSFAVIYAEVVLGLIALESFE